MFMNSIQLFDSRTQWFQWHHKQHAKLL